MNNIYEKYKFNSNGQEQRYDLLQRAVSVFYPNKEAIEVTLQVTEDCSLQCLYCVTGDTLVTMSDRSQRPISDIKIGDEILCCDEKCLPGQNKKIRVGRVEQLFKHTLCKDEKLYKITLSDGNTINITGNHKVLTDNGRYRSIEKLNIGDTLRVHPANTYWLEDSDDYQLGYLIGMWYGDGTYNEYPTYSARSKPSWNCHMYKTRLALKDMEPIYYLDKVMDKLGLDHYLKPFCVSEKYGIYNNAIFSNKKSTHDKLVELINNNLGKNNSKEYLRGFLAGIYDAEGHLSEDNSIRISNTEDIILSEIERALTTWDFKFNREVFDSELKKDNPCYTIRIKSDDTYLPGSIRFCDCVQPKIERKYAKVVGHKYLNKSKIISKELLDTTVDVYNIGTDKHTYLANNILVHNCYEHSKTPKRMTFETAKKVIDRLFIDFKDTHYAITLEFIGGEPMLEPELISKVIDYWDYQCIMHYPEIPWGLYTCFSICSNGTEWDRPEVQALINKIKNRLSFSVSIDGNKELHDSARLHPDGRGSYDEAKHAADEYEAMTGLVIGSKMTIAPSNIWYLYQAIKHYLDTGANAINANTVYEDVWKLEDAQLFYKELKKIADYKLENYPDVYLSLFDENLFHPLEETNLQGWCGGNGKMLCADTEGTFYPCLRYTPSSVGQDRDTYLTCGDIETGIDYELERELQKIDRRVYSNDECFYCPVAAGCGDCTALRWEMFGTIEKRTTFHCWMHKARTLANVYYWNKFYKKYNIDKTFKMYLPEEDALKIISKEEYELLKEV